MAPVAPVLNNPQRRLTHLAGDRTRRYIIGLSGVPGAGKSTRTTMWAHGVAKAAGPGALVVLGMDGFHLTKAQLAAMPNATEAFARRGAPWTFDPAGAATALRSLRNAFGVRSAEWPGFEHGVGDPVPGAFQVPADVPLILVEGIYTNQVDGDWAHVRNQFDEHWYLDVRWDEALPRLVSRHMTSWGMSREDAIAKAQSNDMLNAALVVEGRSRSDYLV